MQTRIQNARGNTPQSNELEIDVDINIRNMISHDNDFADKVALFRSRNPAKMDSSTSSLPSLHH